MADLVSYGNSDRGNEQALIILKKGTQLLKYNRKGKPKFRAFRLSPDETSLIWLSHGEEKNLKLESVTKIIPGQRTPVFRRYLRPEKDYLSFSLIYNNGDRSLDLICKDKVEAEVWLGGLKALIRKSRRKRNASEISDLTETSDFWQSNRSSNASLEFSSSICRGRASVDSASRDPLNLAGSDVGSEHATMQLRASTDGLRISVSSTPSCSSGGSGPDDFESLGDVYVWGEVWSELVSSDGLGSSIPIGNNVLLPKPLESNVVLDVHQISCGMRHVALVTRQGEVFTWGEESGGRLGHGIDKDFSKPRLVELLTITSIDFVACGEHHTCAVSTAGDLFTWGDGTYNAGLLGHGTDASHWIPKRVSGALEGFQVLTVSCGTWHSALTTSNGKLFTFGDGTFGVLGHGDRESVTYPREVQSLSGLKTVKVACGVWHTAAIVELMGQAGSNVVSKKLFTWGDGDKYRLGHGNRDSYLLPTCISSLIDYNFHQLACGHTMTVALTTSGHVFTMGGNAHGQLGSPTSDGKSPSLVQDKLVGEFVEEISCGAYHVAVLTSRSEVFTWGKGSNGQLGHGDTEDRKVPTMVEALKDRHVKTITCGSNFTSSICTHKWVSGTDQSICSGCRQAFGFTRKRHNCYNCGLAHCHACSSKKALKAALAPTPGKPHRVCDSCYTKLKAAEAGNASNMKRRVTTPRYSLDMRDRMEGREPRTSRMLLSPTTFPVKHHESKSTRPESPMNRAAQIPSLSQLKDIAFPSTLSALQSAWRPIPQTPPPVPIMWGPMVVPVPVSVPPPASTSRPSSPYARRPSPPRSTTPTFSRSVLDSLRKTNDILKQDMTKVQNQVKSLKQKCDVQDAEIKKLQKQSQEASSLAAAESSKYRVAKEVVRSISSQLKEITEQLPSDIPERETFKSMNSQIEAFLTANEASEGYSLPDNLDLCHSHENGTISHDSRTSEASTPRRREKESMEQFEQGVYVTYVQLPNGAKLFKRVKFSKKRFKEQEAEVWWKENKDRLLRRYRPPVATTAAPPGSSEAGGEASEPSTSEPAP